MKVYIYCYDTPEGREFTISLKDYGLDWYQDEGSLPWTKYDYVNIALNDIVFSDGDCTIVPLAK